MLASELALPGKDDFSGSAYAMSAQCNTIDVPALPAIPLPDEMSRALMQKRQLAEHRTPPMGAHAALQLTSSSNKRSTSAPPERPLSSSNFTLASDLAAHKSIHAAHSGHTGILACSSDAIALPLQQVLDNDAQIWTDCYRALDFTRH